MYLTQSTIRPGIKVIHHPDNTLYRYEEPKCQNNGCTNAIDSKRENSFRPGKAKTTTPNENVFHLETLTMQF